MKDKRCIIKVSNSTMSPFIQKKRWNHANGLVFLFRTSKLIFLKYLHSLVQDFTMALLTKWRPSHSSSFSKSWKRGLCPICVLLIFHYSLGEGKQQILLKISYVQSTVWHLHTYFIWLHIFYRCKNLDEVSESPSDLPKVTEPTRKSQEYRNQGCLIPKLKIL